METKFSNMKWKVTWFVNEKKLHSYWSLSRSFVDFELNEPSTEFLLFFFSIATWATLLASPFFFITSPFCIPSLKIKSPFSFTVVRVVLCWIGLFWVFGCFKIKMVRIEPTTEFLLALHFFITSPFCSPSLKIESSFSFTVVRLVLCCIGLFEYFVVLK